MALHRQHEVTGSTHWHWCHSWNPQSDPFLVEPGAGGAAFCKQPRHNAPLTISHLFVLGSPQQERVAVDIEMPQMIRSRCDIITSACGSSCTEFGLFTSCSCGYESHGTCTMVAKAHPPIIELWGLSYSSGGFNEMQLAA